MKKATLLAILLASLVLMAAPAMAQLDLPRPSPKATVAQTVGVTDITIAYCRPSVRGRVIWGGLVPYDQVWRTGANEATTITFGDEVAIEGHELPAGTYGLFTIPGKDEWTVIFNKSAKQWGAYKYSQAEDALRIKVKPQPAAFTEVMTFSFPTVTMDSATVALTWEKLEVPFMVQVATVPKVLAAARKAVAEAKPDDFATPATAARFCVDNNVNLDEAKGWIEKSIAIKQTMANLTTKARLLALQGKKTDAIATAKKAIEVGKAADPKADTSMVEKLIADWQK